MRDDAVKIGFALACGAVIGWLWATRPGVLADIKWLDIMTAYGTVGSAAAAAYFGTRDGRRFHQQQIRRARHVATAINVEVSLFHMLAARIVSVCTERPDTLREDMVRKNLYMPIEAYKDRHWTDEADAIAVSSRVCAQALVQGAAQLKALYVLLRDAPFDSDGVVKAFSTLATQCLDNLKLAQDQLGMKDYWG